MTSPIATLRTFVRQFDAPSHTNSLDYAVDHKNDLIRKFACFDDICNYLSDVISWLRTGRERSFDDVRNEGKLGAEQQNIASKKLDLECLNGEVLKGLLENQNKSSFKVSWTNNEVTREIVFSQPYQYEYVDKAPYSLKHIILEAYSIDSKGEKTLYDISFFMGRDFKDMYDDLRGRIPT